MGRKPFPPTTQHCDGVLLANCRKGTGSVPPCTRRAATFNPSIRESNCRRDPIVPGTKALESWPAHSLEASSLDADSWNNNTPWDIDQKRFTPWLHTQQYPPMQLPSTEKSTDHSGDPRGGHLMCLNDGDDDDDDDVINGPDSEFGAKSFCSSCSFTEPVFIPVRRKQAPGGTKRQRGPPAAAEKQLLTQSPCLRGRLITKTGAVWGQYTTDSLRVAVQAAQRGAEAVKGAPPSGNRAQVGFAPAAKVGGAWQHGQRCSKDQRVLDAGGMSAGRLKEESSHSSRSQQVPVEYSRGMAESLKEALHDRQDRNNSSYDNGCDFNDTCFMLRLSQQPAPWRICRGFHV
ncbi:hypothetical protein CEUSTIGMA_g1055.t1 [Chlamydomonas eustigma]|uniref:Uncharacterized protein n=1 Tax=Chlamydomonas eustigma TaxID=1157962 RepID=A0A250WRY1_9CHLO|nr:hypothetical protein CEUSTIGMA_g1055.t1 [Chlamydomonas eustigma]|eukprot:GAX73604.1 hypothetical protein CEUSTIGMA_g1055.t1 [Chlamydomonas eustigma]